MIKELKSQIEYVLSVDEKTRNSDIELMIEVWKRFYPDHIRKGSNGDLGIYLQDLYKVPYQDSIKRIRAMIQSEGKYLPTKKTIAEKRRINMDMWHKAMAFNQN